MPVPSSRTDAPPAPAAVRVWDLPTRLFHGLLLLCVIGLIVTGQVGGGWMTWHFRFGYAMLALLLFRVLWGVVGGRWSRFGSFVRGPRTVWRYLKGQHPDVHADVGHNPLGALSVLGLLGMLMLQVLCGLVADDEIANVGPLNRFVSPELAQWATWWHKEPGKFILLALIALHVAAIAFYRLRKKVDLVGPMLHGDKPLPPTVPSARDDGVTRGLALALLLGCAALVAGIASLAP